MTQHDIDKDWGKGKIFVQIASYRDPECQHTIYDLYKKAKHSEHIYVGVLHQIDPEQDAYCFEVPCPRPNQLREERVHWGEAQGVCWARAKVGEMWRGEEYTLQIDSHMRFAEDWDVQLLEELAMCPSEKPILSGCIARYTPPDKLEPNPKASILRAGVFNHEGNIRTRGAFITHHPTAPLNGAFISAGFLFARSEILEEVPYDPYLYFDQEEIVYGLRLYTYGWDVFSTCKPYVYHYYITLKDKNRRLPAEDSKDNERNKQRYLTLRNRGQERFNHLTGYRSASNKSSIAELEKYGLGNQRSQQDFENYCGIDFRTKRVSEFALRARFITRLAECIPVQLYVPELDDDDRDKNLALMSEEERLSKPGAVTATAERLAGKIMSTPRIFVQIASYRDPECQRTVNDLFAKAKNADRVFVGVCWLFDPKKDKHCFEVPCIRPNQLREKRMHPSKSIGPAWDRVQAHELWQGEEYILQVDSATRFAESWDELLIDMLKRCDATHSALTGYLSVLGSGKEMGKVNEVTRFQVPQLAPYHPQQLVAEQKVEVVSPGQKHSLDVTPFAVHGFIFAPSYLFQQVPPDPLLACKEIDLAFSARLWTHGYTLFQPDIPPAWRVQPPLDSIIALSKQANDDAIKRMVLRVRHLLGLELSEDKKVLIDLDIYNHGKTRALEDFWGYAGLDLDRSAIKAKTVNGKWMREAVKKQSQQRPRIFVQIASYRDPECQHTVKDLFAKATHAERLHVGICWQLIRGEDDDFFSEPYTYPDQVSIIEIDARESKGVCWARAKVQRLWEGEEYTLQIDSHMRFEQGWDELLIKMLAQCPGEKNVLTTYPAGYTPPDNISRYDTHVLVAKQFDEHGIFTMGSLPVQQNLKLPELGAFTSACCLFAKSTIIHEVPYDERLYFFGEEISLSVRLWTHGYDIYHPQKPVMYHCWQRTGRRTHFDDHEEWRKLNELSFQRVRLLLGGEQPKNPKAAEKLANFGLGTTRSLEAYQEFSGVHFAKHEISPSAYQGFFPAASWDKKQRKAPIQPIKDNIMAQNAQAQPMSDEKLLELMKNHQPRKTMETEGALVYDDFLPEEVYTALHHHCTLQDFHYINTHGNVRKVWDLGNGFPLRSEKNVFYYAEGFQKPDSPWPYPSNTPLDHFVDKVNAMMPMLEAKVGHPGGADGWEHFSVSTWLYPTGTGLSLHDDGAGIYTGAYVYFLTPHWKVHWGGLLLVMTDQTNHHIDSFKKGVDGYAFHQQKWLHMTQHEELAMEHGFAHCIMPKRNRMVFIASNAYHMVTQINPSAGDHVRMSLAGFFNRVRNEQA